jgi:hypothetical protein
VARRESIPEPCISAAGCTKCATSSGRVKKRDYDAVKVDAQAIYQSNAQAAAPHAFLRFRKRWYPEYPSIARRQRLSGTCRDC